MADLPYVVCFRVSPELRDWLRWLAKRHHRKLGDVIRLLLESVHREDEDYGKV